MVNYADLDNKERPFWVECDQCAKEAPNTCRWWEVGRFYADSDSSLSSLCNVCSWACFVAWVNKQPKDGPRHTPATIAEDLAAYNDEQDAEDTRDYENAQEGFLPAHAFSNQAGGDAK